MSWLVESVMTQHVVTVRPQATYRELVAVLRERGVSAVPVVDVTDSEGRVVGIVSEADLLLKEERPEWRGTPSRAPGGDPRRKAAGRTAADLMSSPVVTIAAGATLTEAARVMDATRVKRLPVLGEGGRLVGIVSRSDLLQGFLRSEESVRREVQDEVVRALALGPQSLHVSVEQGVVRLEGELAYRSQAEVLAELVSGVEGVVGVDDALTWRDDDLEWVRRTPGTSLRT